MDRRMKRALDRYITGNWGEDQFGPTSPVCEECETEECPSPCEKLLQYADGQVQAQRKIDEAMFEKWRQEEIEDCDGECHNCLKMPSSCEMHRCNFCAKKNCQVEGRTGHIFCKFSLWINRC